MPHVVLDEKTDLKKFSEMFEQLSFEQPLIRIQNIYIENLNRTILLSTVVIEKDHQRFFIEINSKEKKTVVRLHRMTDPEKTEGVKIALGLVTNSLLDIFPTTNIVRTNISDHIPKRK